MPGKQLSVSNGEVRDVAMCEYHEIMRGQPDPDCPLCTEANRGR